MSWNYRILATDVNGDIELYMHEVYYDETGLPNGYMEANNVYADDIKGMKWVLRKMTEASRKPVLWSGSRFPEIYDMNNKRTKPFLDVV